MTEQRTVPFYEYLKGHRCKEKRQNLMFSITNHKTLYTFNFLVPNFFQLLTFTYIIRNHFFILTYTDMALRQQLFTFLCQKKINSYVYIKINSISNAVLIRLHVSASFYFI